MRSIGITIVLTVLLIFGAVSCQRSSVEQDRALLEAAHSGDLKQVRDLLDKGADVNAQDKDGMTPLMWAMRSVPFGGGSLDMVKMLLDRGADANAKDKSGGTALMNVTTLGLDVVELLLDNGADVNAKTTDGFTALMAAVGLADTAVCEASHRQRS